MIKDKKIDQAHRREMIEREREGIKRLEIEKHKWQGKGKWVKKKDGPIF